MVNCGVSRQLLDRQFLDWVRNRVRVRVRVRVAVQELTVQELSCALISTLIHTLRVINSEVRMGVLSQARANSAHYACTAAGGKMQRCRYANVATGKCGDADNPNPSCNVAFHCIR